MDDHDHAERVREAWDNLPHDAKMRMFSDPGMADLYYACARLSAHHVAVDWVKEMVGNG
jgi:hypothetical protein